MAPEILRHRLITLQEVLGDLRPHIQKSRDAQDAAHYEIERQVQLCVELCIAVGRRVLSLKDLPVPEKGADVFRNLHQANLLNAQLAQSLALAVGLRNLIVHEYGAIDYDRFFGGLSQGFAAFLEFSEKVTDLYSSA